MAYINKLEDALIKADAAGNTDDAKALADEIRKARGPQATMTLERSPEPTQRQKDITSFGSRLIRGVNQPIEGLAQGLLHALPEGVVSSVNEFANKVGGPGTFLGDKLGIKGMTKEELDRNISEGTKEFEAARKATTPDTMESMVTGIKEVPFDVAGMIGEGLSPVNLAMMGGGPSLAGKAAKEVATKLGLMGGVAAVAQPLTTTDSFAADKAKQAGIGAATGAVLGPVLMKATDSMAKYVSNKLASGRASKDIGGLETEISATLKQDGIDLSQIPERIRFELIQDVKKSIKEGKNLDVPSMLRRKEFEKAGIEPLLGQVTREPGQYSRELNLRGIQGVGEPVTERLAQQQEKIAEKFRSATQGAKEPFEAGEQIVKSLESKNFEMEQGVRKAYKSFKESTGKDLEVPLQGLAQDYSRILDDFQDNIPGAVRKQFESLGLLSGKQNKFVTVEGAEKLIQTINKNYDPTSKPNIAASNELRSALTRAIDTASTEANDTLGGMLAKNARATASERFKTIESSPAFKAVVNEKASPDDFVKKYVIGGKVEDIENLSKLVTPETRDQMKTQFMRFLQNKAFGSNAAGDVSSRQASFNDALKNIGTKKLEAVLGKELTEEMQNLGRVMAYIQQRPAGSSVNESGTAAAVANILGKLGGTMKGTPYIADFVVKPLEGMRQRKQVGNALSAKLPSKATEIDPKVMRALSRLVGSSTVIGGISAGQTVE